MGQKEWTQFLTTSKSLLKLLSTSIAVSIEKISNNRMTGFHFLKIFKSSNQIFICYLGVKLGRSFCAFTSIHRWCSYPVTRLSGKKTLFWPASQKHRHDAICSSYRMVYNVGNSFIVLLTILTPSVILLGIFPWVTVIIGKHILIYQYITPFLWFGPHGFQDLRILKS